MIVMNGEGQRGAEDDHHTRPLVPSLSRAGETDDLKLLHGTADKRN